MAAREGTEGGVSPTTDALLRMVYEVVLRGLIKR